MALSKFRPTLVIKKYPQQYSTQQQFQRFPRFLKYSKSLFCIVVRFKIYSEFQGILIGRPLICAFSINLDYLTYYPALCFYSPRGSLFLNNFQTSNNSVLICFNQQDVLESVNKLLQKLNKLLFLIPLQEIKTVQACEYGALSVQLTIYNCTHYIDTVCMSCMSTRLYYAQLELLQKYLRHFVYSIIIIHSCDEIQESTQFQAMYTLQLSQMRHNTYTQT